ncbi:MAC/perforin domain-containing protein [Trinickia dinghuensis]|uniref:MACPF domain-containing protein n=1 Tax=Trinickia dinghuensis TaxID=2291023 RepID=A0A3D8JU77_9BURK|nr:MAC/perforin domain-containing protein [Trinickia dinghuensis]RDU95941.1 hypothetical protein DWV00_25075 [Trinickia dinghuensis]
MNDRVNDAVAVSNSNVLDVVGGINALGCGINKLLWAGKVKSLNQVLDAQSDKVTKEIDGKTYTMGKRVEFTRNTGSKAEISTFESVAEYNKKSSVKANAKGSYGLFSAGFDSTFGQSISQLEEYYAGVRNQTEQLWTLQVKNLKSNLSADFITAVKALPEAFKDDLSNINAFVDFFDKFGTDVVTDVTVGGNMTYSVMIQKSQSTKKTDLDAAISVGYGAFVANASTSISEEHKNLAKKQKVVIKTWGGTADIVFDHNAPANCHSGFQDWRKSLSQAPQVVDMELDAIYKFIPDDHEKQRRAVEQAREWYLGYEAKITADWQGSYIGIKRSSDRALMQAEASGQQVQAGAAGKPALHLVIVGKGRHVRVDEMLTAPGKDDNEKAFEDFWALVSQKLRAVAPEGHEMILLATARWPRDLRYYPSEAARNLLRDHGASDKTLDRWHKLVRHMQRCSVTGMTYVLAGRARDKELSDFVVAGFGVDQDLCPTVTVTARFIGSDAETSRVLVTDWSEETKTKLYVIRNLDGDKPALAAGTQLKTTIEMVRAGEKAVDGGTYLGQYWYFLRFPRYNETPNSHILINYETGACLQSFIQNKGNCKLQAYGDDNPYRHDDIIWDIRGTPANTNFLVLHAWMDSWNLTQNEKSATVREWRKDYMIWSLEAFNNLNW